VARSRSAGWSLDLRGRRLRCGFFLGGVSWMLVEGWRFRFEGGEVRLELVRK